MIRIIVTIWMMTMRMMRITRKMIMGMLWMRITRMGKMIRVGSMKRIGFIQMRITRMEKMIRVRST